MKKLLIALTTLILMLPIGNAYAPDEQKFKVCVDMNINPREEYRTQQRIIESHLKRELRALGDVEIVDTEDDWQFRIAISAIGTKYKDGRAAPEMVIAKSVQRKVPKFYFRTYDFKAPIIPVYDSGPLAAIWHKDKLLSWCISAADDFNEEHLKFWRKQ